VQGVQVTLPPGSVLQDRYVVESLLGRGGFGAVYLIRDVRSSHNLFALKEVIDPDKRERRHFIFESELLKRLDHPALPRVYRVFEDEAHDRAYMLMDYIEGLSLEKLRQQQPQERFSLPQALNVMAPVIDAVRYLHSQQPPILHRDIKPSNIIVSTTSNEVVLVDLGIAKEYNPDSTTTAIRRCSPGYAALEQYRKGTNTRTDIYGLAATIYTLLTGTVPADALRRMVLQNSEGTEPLEPVSMLAPNIPQPVADAIIRAMSLNSDDRFATVEQFWQALNAGSASKGQPVIASIIVPSASSPPLSLPTPLPAAPQQPGVTPSPVPISSSSLTSLPNAFQQPTVAPARATVSIRKQPTVRHLGKLAAVLLILLALLTGLGIGTGLWSYILTTSSSVVRTIGLHVTPTPAQGPTSQATGTVAVSLTLAPRPTMKPTTVSNTSPPGVVPTLHPTTAPVPYPTSGPPRPVSQPSPLPTPRPRPVPYPNVAGNYSGTIDNTTANIATSMALSIHQKKKHKMISGHFTVGAPLLGNGHFTGFVGTDPYIQFTVVPQNKNLAPLFFYGWVQTDGSIKGHYCSLNKQGECDQTAGAGGIWYIIQVTS
jgi:serine/threonine protein kinase